MATRAAKQRTVRTHTLYMIRYRDDGTVSGVTCEWFTTFTKAARRLRKLKLQDSESVQFVEVPRTKVAIAEWLNAQANVG